MFNQQEETRENNRALSIREFEKEILTSKEPATSILNSLAPTSAFLSLKFLSVDMISMYSPAGSPSIFISAACFCRSLGRGSDCSQLLNGFNARTAGQYFSSYGLVSFFDFCFQLIDKRFQAPIRAGHRGGLSGPSLIRLVF